MNTISIIVPVWNEVKNIRLLVTEIQQALEGTVDKYEIIFIDDNSTDRTRAVIKLLRKNHPVRLYLKKGKKGKAYSILEGIKYAKYDLLCMIDADLQYPPQYIPEMIQRIENGADIVVANRKKYAGNILRSVLSKGFHLVFTRLLHGFKNDVQSGLKVFTKEVARHIKITPSAWTFDLEFLLKAKHAGFVIEDVDVEFKKRHSGKSKIAFVKASTEIGLSAIKLKRVENHIVPFPRHIAKERGKGFHHKGKEFVHHTNLGLNDIAYSRLTLYQMLSLAGLAGILIAGFILNWHLTLVILVSTLSILYFTDLLFNLFLIYRSFSKAPEVTISKKEIEKVDETVWPSYTIFCPLYKEWNVVPQFIDAMSKLDYPKEKLQVMLLLEEDDKETINKIRDFDLPKYFEIVVVPDSKPKTKPKAMNYGMKYATGDYIVVYDAEDIPEPDQLKKAVLAFKKAGKSVVCIQAKLNFYNPYQNLLTRIFTAEYSLWFDLVLTGLQSIQAPIPLGGTSNHFKKKELMKLKNWDSFNVTEDADLGMRLAKAGYSTAIVDSTTYEEANSSYTNWFHQRTRWIKGYIQTYFVHMRNPKDLILENKKSTLITFNMIIGGKIISMFINPFMWAITLSYFAFKPYIGEFIESFFPGPILYIAVFSLVFGNFLYFYYYLIGCAKRGYGDIMKYLFFVPVYWLAMSVAAWVATYKFIYQPFYWSKTKHGLHLAKETTDSTSIYMPKQSIFGRLSYRLGRN